jgi:hypothetical protein
VLGKRLGALREMDASGFCMTALVSLRVVSLSISSSLTSLILLSLEVGSVEMNLISLEDASLEFFPLSDGTIKTKLKVKQKPPSQIDTETDVRSEQII